MKRLLFVLGLGAVALASGCNRPYYNGYYQQPYAPAYPAVQGYQQVQPQYAPTSNCAPVYGPGVQPTYSVPAGGVPIQGGAPMSAVAPGGLQPIASNPAYAPTYAAPGAAPMY